MKLKDLVNVTAWYTHVIIHEWNNEHSELVADCSISEIVNMHALSEMTLEKEVDFIAIRKDRKGISLSVTIIG